MLAWGIALGIRLSGKSSAESAIQSLPGDWRMAHMMIEFVQQVNRAFSAGAFFVPRILGRCPRLAVNRAFGAKLVPVARIASLSRRSLLPCRSAAKEMAKEDFVLPHCFTDFASSAPPA